MSDKELKTTENRAIDCLERLICNVTCAEFNICNWKQEAYKTLREMFGDQLDEWEDITNGCWISTSEGLLEIRSFTNCAGGYRVGKIQNGEVILHSDVKIENGRIWKKK
jgi:hypothetical protein